DAQAEEKAKVEPEPQADESEAGNEGGNDEADVKDAPAGTGAAYGSDIPEDDKPEPEAPGEAPAATDEEADKDKPVAGRPQGANAAPGEDDGKEFSDEDI